MSPLDLLTWAGSSSEMQTWWQNASVVLPRPLDARSVHRSRDTSVLFTWVRRVKRDLP
jgi:hypothetical protein